jgi:hypothetical protein
MTLTRITSIIGAVALGGVLVASNTDAQAARAPASPDRAHHHHARTADRTDHFEAPVPHKYGPNGMRLGLHCETKDMS